MAVAAESTSPEGPTPTAEREAPICTISAAAVAEAAQQVIDVDAKSRRR